MSLAIIETHPVQYHAPVYRAVQQEFGIPVTAIYGSNFSVAGYRDPEFQTQFAWDQDLLSGYSHIFLSRVADGGATNATDVTTAGLSQALSNLRPAAVMTVGYSPAFHRHAALRAFQLRVPVMLRAETGDSARERTSTTAILRDVSLRFAYHFYSAFLFIGQRSREHYERLGVPAEKLYASPYCVDAAPFMLSEDDHRALRQETRRELDISDDADVILFSGKFTPHKNVASVIEAAQQLSTRRSLVIVLVGDGAQRDELANTAAKLGVDLRMVGFKNQRQLSPYYHAADVLVLPSRGETWGLVVNEALMHGVPCVVTDAVGCAPDLVHTDRTGYTYPVDDVTGLAIALEKCLTLAHQPETRARCMELASQYSVSAAARGIATAYRATVDNNE